MRTENITVGQAIRRRRRELELTQGELGIKTGFNTSKVHRIESGQSLLTVRDLIKIAAALHIQPGELITGTPVAA